MAEDLAPEVRSQIEHLITCDPCRRIFTDLLPRSRTADNVLFWPTAAPPLEETGGCDRASPGANEPPVTLGVEAWFESEVFDPLEAWALAEKLLAASRQERHQDPERAENLALAVDRLTEHPGVESYAPPLAADLRALAWSYVGAARRAAGDMRSAEEALEHSQECLEHGSGDTLERAVILEILGALRKDQRRFREAETLLARASRLFQALGDDEAASRTLVTVANVLHERGEVEQAIVTLRRAAARVRASRDQQLLLAIHHNLGVYLADAGRYQEAARQLASSESLYGEFADDSTHQVRRRWLEAKIARGLGHLEAAEEGFLAVREGFVHNGVGYDAALVSLELATLYAEQGRFTDVRDLANEMLPIFRAQDIHREALAALAVFQQAARLEKVTLKLARDIAAYIERARSNPELRFEPGR